ncbi:MAG: D-alanyl-D-alanine carboxypeptidase [Gammaproteobacteria bacterium]|nr:D-alanyl-D-alanine carboxypeptidase [Gammaproteobacteria bacterium]
MKYRFLLFVLVFAAGLAKAALPGVPAPPQLSGNGYILMDFTSASLLAAQNEHSRLEPASLTKIMTIYIAAQELARGSIHMDDMVTISEKAWRMEGSRMFIEVGKQVALHDLLRGIVIQSGNDASVALAEHISGDESVFAQLMNAQAQRIGMKDSHFSNATGLPDEYTYTTPYDLALLTRALISEFPDIYALFAEKEYVFNGIKQHNRNGLLAGDASADGVKTGHTEAAGYCLVGSAERDGMRLISVIMGTESDNARTTSTRALMNYGFRFFESHKLYAAGQTLTEAAVFKGAESSVPIGLANDLFVLIPRGRYQELTATVELANPLIAPISPGEGYGNVILTLGDTELERIPVTALTAVPEAGIIGRSIDSIRLMFE